MSSAMAASVVVTLVAVALGSTYSAGAASRQWANNEGRYQIEMVIFERREHQKSSKTDLDEEFWRRDISLNYPENYRQLIKTTSSRYRDFSILPRQAQVLVGVKRRLDSNRGYRVLFHEAWRQPIADKGTPAVIINGGDNIGRRHRLEGSIQLRVSRYLHIETHLWLTQLSAGSTAGAPDRKTATPGASENNAKDPTKDGDTEGKVTESEANSTAHPPWPPLPGLPINRNRAATAANNRQPSHMPYHLNRVQRIALFNEKRRMRSKELHYIDHPLMGLLIIITPVG